MLERDLAIHSVRRDMQTSKELRRIIRNQFLTTDEFRFFEAWAKHEMIAAALRAEAVGQRTAGRNRKK